MVKNTVIVPVGSKGGFFCKQLPDPTVDRDAWLAEGKECYRRFINGLLDITDNLAGGKVVHSANVVRHDDDDPYLVVAADKGTATFRSEEHTSELQSLLRISYAVFCLKKKKSAAPTHSPTNC